MSKPFVVVVTREVERFETYDEALELLGRVELEDNESVHVVKLPPVATPPKRKKRCPT